MHVETSKTTLGTTNAPLPRRALLVMFTTGAPNLCTASCSCAGTIHPEMPATASTAVDYST